MFESNGAMSETSNSNATTTTSIKERLKDALEEIVFISGNAFIEDSSFKRANQALYAKIRKWDTDAAKEDAKGPNNSSSRYVSDPDETNVVKYGQPLFEFNELRESLFSPACCNALQCPIGHNEDADGASKEPWSNPEGERILKHIMLSSSYNFNLYETELEKLVNVVDESSSYCGSPIFDRLFDRLQFLATDSGAQYLTDRNDKEFEALREKILTAQIRNLWEDSKTVEKVVEALKSPLGNVFLGRDEDERENSLLNFDSDSILKNLINSITILNQNLPKADDFGTNKPKQIDPVPMEIPQPQRRLYSDVVQGNKSPLKIPSLQIEPLSPKSDTCLNDVSFIASRRSCSECQTSPLAIETPLLLEKFEALIDDDSSSQVASNFETPRSEVSDSVLQNHPKSPNSANYSYPDVNYGYSANQYNLPFLNEAPTVENIRTTSSASNVHIGSHQQPQFMPNIYNTTNTNYRFGPYQQHTANLCPNSNFINCHHHSINPRPTIEASTLCHQQLQQAQQQPWMVTPYRSTACNVFLLPQWPAKQQRWTPTATPAPNICPAAQQQQQPMHPTWKMQNASCTVTNMHQMPQMAPNFLLQDSLARKMKTQQQQQATSSKLQRPCPVQPCPLSENTSRASSVKSARHMRRNSEDFRVISRPHHEKEASGSGPSNMATDDQMIHINFSISDDLEKIALMEYQSSSPNDIFFSEIERQAKEQYDGNPENFNCPPNEESGPVGGLLRLVNIRWLSLTCK